jgi:hypothetical protein
MRLPRALLTLLLPIALLLPVSGTPGGPGAEAPWRAGGWARSFAVPRPTLPGQPAFLEAGGAVGASLRLRLHRVKDPAAFLDKLLRTPDGEPFLEGGRGPADPLDTLREALLWSGRRAFVTVHRTATRALRDLAKGSERLQPARTPAGTPEPGGALPLEGRPDLELVEERIPRITEETAAPTPDQAKEPPPFGDEAYRQDVGRLSRLELPPQPAGLYVVELLNGSEAAYVPWLVTDLALLAEQDGSRLRLQAVQALDGAARPGVPVQLYEAGRPRALGATGSDGTLEAPAGPGLRRIVLAGQGASFALLAIQGQSFAAVQQRLYAFTERPLYRPGQEVHVKAVLRVVEDLENQVAKGVASLPYRVLDPEDVEVAKGEARLLSADTGSYGADFRLPGKGRLGLHRVVFQGPRGPGQAEFKVEQFQKPAFTVAVTAPKAKVGLGDPLPFHVEASYFYGAAVREAKADWFLYKVVPRRDAWYLDDDAGPAPELMESGQLTLDAGGKGDLDQLKAESDGLWRLVVKVTDSSGQANSGLAQVRAAAADLVLRLETDRLLAAPGKSFQVTARALDLDGNPQPGTAVALKACRVVAEQGETWSDPTRLKPGEVVAQAPGPTAALTIPQGGEYLLVAEARDRSGRPVTAQRLVTVADEGTQLPAVAELRAAADRPEYRPGDTARILVQLPRPRLTLRWTVEHEALAGTDRRLVQGTTAVVTIPVTKAMQPNAWAVFQVVAEGRRQLAEVPLRVPRADRRLQVDVRPDRERYQPGQPMQVEVQVKGADGRPAAADLSLGVVDEAIYALSQELNPDPVRFFNPARRHAVLRAGSSDWSFYDLLRVQRPVGSLKQTRRGDFKEDEAAKLRQNFQDLAHWAPMIAVGRDGKARASFTLPDNLTAWRATATALTADTRMGVGRASRPASKPLQVSLTLPRALALGDRARAIALVRNLSGRPLAGKVALEAANGTLEGAGGEFNLPDQGEYRLSLPLSTVKTGALAVTAKVQGGGLQDGERRTVQVEDPLVPASVSGALVLDGDPHTVTVPAPAKAAGEASLVLTPVGSLEHLLGPSLPYLIAYPYGCVEQVLSSFMPNLLVADLARRKLMPPLDWPQLKDLDRNVRDGVFQVYACQLPNGGWGWWSPKDFGLSANPHTTGYALQSFAIMKQLGYAVDENVSRRGRQAALAAFREAAQQADARGAKPYDPKAFPNQSEDPAADAAFLLLSLAQAGEPVAGLLESTADKVLRGVWPGAHVAAMTALAAAQAGHPRAEALLAKVEAAVVRRGGTAHWEGPRDHWYGYASGDVVPTVMALKALCLRRPDSPLIAEGEAYLATEYRGCGWYSTWSTAQALSLVPYLAKLRPLHWEALNLKAAVQDGPAWDFASVDRLAYRPWGARDPRPGFLPLAEPRPVTFTASGKGIVVWTYAYQVPGSAVPAPAGESSGALRLGLSRKLWRLRTPQQTGNPKHGWVRVPWTGTLAQGDEAWMELDLRCAQSADYVLLEVPVPAGLEPIVKLEGLVLEGRPLAEGDVTDAWDKPRIEVRPDKVCFIFQHLGSWQRPKVRLLLRAGMAGNYRIRPARLVLMSNEAQWTTCDGAQVTVQEGGQP